MENKLADTLNRYFNRLSQVGYIPDVDVFSVLILDYITGIKESYTLTSEEESVINKALNCLQGTCLIPYRVCKGTCTR